MRLNTELCSAFILAASILLSAPIWAATYHVKTTGNDSHSCTQAQNQSTPKATINSALKCIGTGLGAGANQIVRVYQGEYAETFPNVMPGGTSWSASFVLEANPGDIVTLRPSSSCGILIDMRRSTTQYVIIRGFTSARLVVDASNCSIDAIKITSSSSTGSSHHIRLQDVEVKNARNHGVLVTESACCNEFINVWVHNNGSSANTNQTHGLYVQSKSNLFENILAEHNWNQGLNLRRTSCSGAQCTTNSIIRNSVFRYNGRSGSGNGISYGAGEHIQFYNNLFYKNANSGILCSTTANNAQIFNNTFWNNGYYGTRFESPNCTNTQVKNNIIWQNGRGSIFDAGVGTSDSNNLTSDPKFVDPAKDDFRLQTGSPAIDTGIPLSLISSDLTGAKRPQGSGYDIGAFEYGGSTPISTPLAPAQLQAVSQ